MYGQIVSARGSEAPSSSRSEPVPAPIEPVNNLPLGKYEVTLKPTEKTRSAAEGCPVPLEVWIMGRAGEAELTIQPGAQSVQNGFIVASRRAGCGQDLYMHTQHTRISLT